MRQACGVVLAGGQSTRFGSDKALASLRGKPLLAHVLQGLCAAEFAQIGVAAKETRPYAGLADEIGQAFGVRIELLGDPHPAQTPLSGLAAALGASRHELVFVCAADMPFAADAALIDALASAIARRDAAVPEAGGALQPLCALWRRSRCEPIADELLASPRPPGPRALLPRLRWARVQWHSTRPFLDADTQQALRELERLP